MATLQEQYSLRTPAIYVPKVLPEHSYRIMSDCAIGIEVEVENVVHSVVIPRSSAWTLTTDGSLRNSGHEFISKPIPASNAPGWLQQLLTTILSQDCHFSPRTSVHVHMNAQDMTEDQIVDFTMLYTIYEKLFYKFAGRGRIRNIFCVPIHETRLLFGIAQTKNLGDWSKYTGLNLAPLLSRSSDDRPAYGTIEFRQMHGTFSVDKLCIWIDLITTLKEYVLKMDSGAFRRDVMYMDDSYDFDGLLRRIFGDKAQYLKLTGLEEVHDTMLAAKLAMCDHNKTLSHCASTTNRQSSFFKFKE